jgi:acyl transferase domain-containing protein
MNGLNKIAIVGADVNVPGAKTLHEFMEIILSHKEALTDVAPNGISEDGLVSLRPILEGEDLFDAEYFGLSRADALAMDPQHRLFLSACRSLLYTSGFNSKKSPRVAVFAGCDESKYERRLNPLEDEDPLASFNRYVAIDRDFLATRVAYLLDLRGPAINIQTGCSTSLVAVHMAAQSLLNHECDAAIAGGVSLQIPQRKPYEYFPEMIYSRDGRCRPFDADADGTNLASGLGVVLLKRYEDAVADNDRIIAVISGSYINNDGRRKVSLTAPSPSAQREAIEAAISRSEIDVEKLAFVETHGTATKLGDPIEFSALKGAITGFTKKQNFCSLTGVKANFGHLGYAAGVVSLIKAALCLEYGVVPGMTNFRKASPYIQLESSPFYIQEEHSKVVEPGAALVSSLGAGGTNSCVVLEAFSAEKKSDRNEVHLLPFSDDKPEYLRRNMNVVELALKEGGIHASSASTSLKNNKNFGGYRGAIVVDATGSTSQVPVIAKKNRPPRFCFVVPGQSAQRQFAYKSLYENNAVFKKHFDYCADKFQSLGSIPIASALWYETEKYRSVFNETWVAQPVIFSLQYAFVKTLSEFGIVPSALVGHSFGEFLCLWLSNQLTLDQAVNLAMGRANALRQIPDGRMLMVSGLSTDEVASILPSDLYIGAINGPNQIIVVGRSSDVSEFADGLRDKKIQVRELSNNGAFHSPLVGSALKGFLDSITPFDASRPTISMYSTVTGRVVGEDGIGSIADYIYMHGTSTVRFTDALIASSSEADIFLEIGDTFLSNWLLSREAVAFPLFEQSHLDESAKFLFAVGRCWSHGAELASQLFGNERPYQELPGYAFKFQSYWPTEDAIHSPRLIKHLDQDRTAVIGMPDIKAAMSYVLNRDLVNDNDDFFEIGGHSLSAFSLCRRLASMHKINIRVHVVFQERTPEKIYAYLSQ